MAIAFGYSCCHFVVAVVVAVAVVVVVVVAGRWSRKNLI